MYMTIVDMICVAVGMFLGKMLANFLDDKFQISNKISNMLLRNQLRTPYKMYNWGDDDDE